MNYLYYDKKMKYPSEKYNYSPSFRYPEYQGKDISIEENTIYDSIRNIFKNIGLDIKNYNTSKWNPLGKYIQPGDFVLIKPNLVLHKNNLKGQENSLDCLVTHPSIIRCILDYVLIALKGKGVVYVGDSPVKDCNMPLLMKYHHYDIVRNYYHTEVDISWVDLRGPEEERQEIVKLNGIKVNLDKDSYFYNYNNQKRLRIPNYDYHKVIKHHNGHIQEYYVNEIALKANVIINLPKPKTHRKSGYTGALKNFVGINYSKEFLPHHTLGDQKSGGDEFYKRNILKRHASAIRAQRDIIRTKSNSHINNKIYKLLALYERFIWTLDNKINSNQGLEKINEGTWYRNDTLWRTVLDLNKVVHYADINGNLHNTMQRKVIHFCDMVISGEGEGPLAPSPKKENILLFGTNGVELDALIVRLMHFNMEMLSTIYVALKDKLLENVDYNQIMVNSNIDSYDNILLKNLKFDNFKPFQAANGWYGYIEESC